MNVSLVSLQGHQTHIHPWGIGVAGRGGVWGLLGGAASRPGIVRTDEVAPRWAVPVSIVPVSLRAVIALAPGAVSLVAADQVTPSGEVHSTGCCALAGPARPTAAKPWSVAVTAVTVAWPCGALSTTWVTWAPPSPEVTTMGTAPALSGA